MSRFALSALVAALGLLSVASPILAANSTVCNGYAAFCSRSYSNVTYIGAHDSYAVYGKDDSTATGLSLAANQNYTVKTQLDNGIRLLQVQGHMKNGALHLCHTTCSFLDAGNFTTYLSTVKTWLDANPTEVVTLVLVNSDGLAASVWGAAYATAGLTDYVFTPATVPIARGDWPTLGSLISAGTRLVSFLAQEADFSSVPFLIDEFANVWETPYDVTDPTFPCSVDRVTGSYSTHMYMINHFLDVNQTILGTTFPVPATAALATTNAATGAGSLGAQKDECVALAGYAPTFTLVDFYDVGNVFQYAATVNGVKYVAGTVGSGTSSAGGAKATTTSAGGGVTSQSLSGGGGVRVSWVGAGVGVVGAVVGGGMMVW